MLEQLRFASGSCRLEGARSRRQRTGMPIVAITCPSPSRSRVERRIVPADRSPTEASASSEGSGGFWRDRGWRARLARTTVATWIGAGLTMLSVVVAARALGPESYGVVVLALSVTAVAARFLDFTFGEAVVHHGHRALAAGDVSGLRALMRMSLILDVVIGVAVAATLLLLAAPLAGIAGDIDPALVRLAALGVLVVTVDGTTGAVLLVASRPDRRAWVQAAASLFRVLGTVAAVALGGGAEAILLSYACAGAASSLLLAWIGLADRMAPVGASAERAASGPSPPGWFASPFSRVPRRASTPQASRCFRSSSATSRGPAPWASSGPRCSRCSPRACSASRCDRCSSPSRRGCTPRASSPSCGGRPGATRCSPWPSPCPPR